MAVHGSAALSILDSLSALVILFALIQNDVISFKNDSAEIAVNGLLQIQGIRYVSYNNKFA